jgi:aldehyde dehydrogenase (NAD+)
LEVPVNNEAIRLLVDRQRQCFRRGMTLEYEYRREQLMKLKRLVKERESDIYEALRADLGRPAMESFFGEFLMVEGEVEHAIRDLRKWMKPKATATPLLIYPGSSEIHSEPYGVVLILAPWNYPFLLLMMPLIGAIAAGNCIIAKPSELAPHTSSTIARMLQDAFDPETLAVVEGGVEESQALLSQKFDYIFYTGSTKVGRIVMESAARQLTPVTLELGGKSPCIVDRNLHMESAARRITWGKFFNAGQTCVAPDYLLVNKAVRRQVLEGIERAIKSFYGDDPAKSPDYCRIISDSHFERLKALLGEGRIIVGGDFDKESRYIAPTVIGDVSWESAIMEEEIFGPLLPVLDYENIDEAINRINERPRPLALYLFSEDEESIDMVMHRTTSGGLCINDTIVHSGSRALPFGGVGESGMGAYHGKATFDTFTHFRSVMKRPLSPDPSFRYPPYIKLSGAVRSLFKYLG